MAVQNPCCMSLETGVKVVAIVNMVLDVIVFVLYLIVAIDLQSAKFKFDGASSFVVLGTTIAVVGIIIAIGRFVLEVVLYQGATKRDRSKCKLWFIVTIVLTVIYFLLSILGMISTGSGASIISILIVAVVVGYELWVVYAFMDELENSPGGRQYRIEEGDNGQNPGFKHDTTQ